MPKQEWIDVGAVAELSRRELQPVTAKRTRIALCYRDGQFSAISGVCNHVGGPLGEGKLDGEYVTCPWHYWKFHYRTGKGEPGFEEDRVPSYPLTVHLSKVWIAKTVGNWNESAVNSIHLFWFLALLGIFFSALKRELNAAWAIAGTAALVSLPLLLVHGVNAYSDVLMGGFVFAALYSFYRWMKEGDEGAKRSWLLIFAGFSAAMIFVKNEALLIFIPTIGILFAYACSKAPSTKHQILNKSQALNPKRVSAWNLGFISDLGFGIWDFLIWLLIVSSVVVPWTLFKWFEGLTFGNATAVSGFSLEVHEGVAFAVEGDLLYTGSYLLFFPLFLLLLFMGWRFYLRKSLGALVAFFLIVLLGEFCIYLLTPLATEAIRHTGFGRGMVHLLPVGVFISIMILQKLFSTGEAVTSR